MGPPTPQSSLLDPSLFFQPRISLRLMFQVLTEFTLGSLSEGSWCSEVRLDDSVGGWWWSG